MTKSPFYCLSMFKNYLSLLFVILFLFVSCSKKGIKPESTSKDIVESKKDAPSNKSLGLDDSLLDNGNIPDEEVSDIEESSSELVNQSPPRPATSTSKRKKSSATKELNPEFSIADKPDELKETSLDDALSQLSEGTMAFNTPEKLNFKETDSIHLVLSPNKVDEELARLVEEKGQVVTESVKFSKIVEARLEGQNFEIEAITAARQPVSLKDTTEWRWQITPIKAGSESLYLNIYAVVKIDGEKHERLLKTFTREMLIDISFIEHPVEFIKHSPSFAYISIAGGTCLFFLGFSFIKTRRRRSALGEAVSIGSKSVNADIFISYSSKDREFSSKLAELLRVDGLSVWMDVGGIAPAAMWSTEIVNALKSAKLVVLVGSINSFQSHNVVKEVSIASEQQTPIIPLIIDDSEIPDKLAYQLAGVQVVRSSKDEIENSAELISEIISKESSGL